MTAPVSNRLTEMRKSRGLTPAALALRVGVSRQTVYSIESGAYVPNTELTLRIARELECDVESLFSLTDSPRPGRTVDAEPLRSSRGGNVSLAKVGRRWVAAPTSLELCFLPDADGTAQASSPRTTVRLWAGEEELPDRLLVAGCDPALGLLATASRNAGTTVLPVPASSSTAIDWLRRGLVHAAGTHLAGPGGEFNLPAIRRRLGARVSVFTFAEWEQGFAVAAGNPKQIRAVEHLTKRGVRIVNRETGSGSRSLLDSLLRQASIDSVRLTGYAWELSTHLAVAAAIAGGRADCGITTRCAARAFGLDFVPLRAERFDFAIRRSELNDPRIQGFLDTLQRLSLRKKIAALAGYDVSHTGVQRL